ncbi:MAG TPA: nucleotidyltransferase domain-containing protein [Gemmatimonadaceae bacterium]|nr:nucleotidyltransferase domain-containing protein [Gemmatimonadaceae bacterium]
MTAADLERIARTYGIRLILQFGSTVTGQLHPASDVDLAVVLDRPAPTLEERAGLLHELQGLFPDREVDLAILDRAGPLFLGKVTESCRLLHGEPSALQRLKLYAFRRYQDHRKYLYLERRFVARAVADPPRAWLTATS